jgi:pyruvate formate lyase activating enzyme
MYRYLPHLISRGDIMTLYEARYYEKINDKYVKCNICHRHCVIGEGKRGFCKGREHIGEKLYVINYGKVCSAAIDPIEKKPLFHFYPGSSVFSIATGGCNFRCKHCQNWQISQFAPDEIPYTELYPDDILKATLDYGCSGVAYTYTEPTIFYELMNDTSQKAKNNGLYNVMITNGYIEKEPLIDLKIDAMNIDIKGNESFYKEICLAELEPVLETCIIAKKLGIHIEITNLIIPSYNDNMDDLLNIIHFVKDKLGDDTPLHFTRFYPNYKLKNIPPTHIETLIMAKELAENEGLKYVYVGNVAGNFNGENTYCPYCNELLIKRDGYLIVENHLDISSGIPKCPKCHKKIEIII